MDQVVQRRGHLCNSWQLAAMQLDSNRLQQHEQVGNLGLETSFQLVRLVECGLRASVGAKLTSHAWKRFENVCLASFVIISTEDDCCYDMHHGSTPYQLDLTRIYRDWRHSGTSFRDHQRDEYGICVLVGSGVSVRSLLSYHIPARCLRSSNTNLLSVPDGYLYSAQCKWRNGENNRFRVRFRVRDMSGFDYFRHCAICIAPFGQWNPPQRICGGVRRVVATEEQRYGPRWLCDNDDDDLHCAEYRKPRSLGSTQPLLAAVSALLPLSMELTSCWHSRLFFITYFPSSS